MTIGFDNITPNPAALRLVELGAGSKLAKGDSSLYSFSSETAEFAARFMGWTTLSSNPPYPIDDISAFAAEMRRAGLTDVLLIGQGGSTQASMTMASLLAAEGALNVRFHTMDCLSPEYVSQTLQAIEPASSLFIVSSKSGSTIEPSLLFRCIWDFACRALGPKGAAARFVAITDPGSQLEQEAREKGFIRVFPGLPSVGGRFSALSVFGLVPFALMGIDLRELIDCCAAAEQACARDALDNPALLLAASLHAGLERGRDKLSINFSPSCESFGLWLEQLIAESTGKHGSGLLPNTEQCIELLSASHADRMALVYSMAVDESEEQARERAQRVAQDDLLALARIDDALDAAAHMVLWEYATAMLAALMLLNPFDQPDVETTKKAVRAILYGGEAPDVLEGLTPAGNPVALGFTVSPALVGAGAEPQALEEALGLLLARLGEGEYFSLNAFLPAYDAGRLEVLGQIRQGVAAASGCVSCLEMGPRYLHSIGQFQKGGFDKGVFLLLSSPEAPDLPIPGENFTLATMAAVQARGDFEALAAAGRRVLLVHLSSNAPANLRALAALMEANGQPRS